MEIVPQETIESLKQQLATITRENERLRATIYKEIADEFHPKAEMNEAARGLCAQFEALFLRRAQAALKETP